MEPADELGPSVMGSKEHWDLVYTRELKDYVNDAISGEDWFGPAIGKKIVQFLKRHASVSINDSIIDLGCGCGAVISTLHENGFTNLTGVDFSEKAIELCKKLAEDEDIKARFEVADLVDGISEQMGHFKVGIDKGTYDAISLTPDRDQATARQKYLDNVHRLLLDNGTFILASCNWTQTELISHTSRWFSFDGIIETTKFSFGGSVGNDVAIVIFKKKNET